MTTFAELLLPRELSVDRDEVEHALGRALGDRMEVTGAGTGVYGSNLDLEIAPDVEPSDQIAAIRGSLAALGVIGGKLRIEGSDQWSDL